jgi:DNA-binding winged helix-turn-helix (wHTH) protein
MADTEAPRKLTFGEFELDSAAYELRRSGQPVRLERRPMDLLLLLLERRGQLVSRAEIIDRLWGDGVFVDVDTGINTAVRKLRQALRDPADAPVFVHTVAGKGYRFADPVEERGDVGVEPDPAVGLTEEPAIARPGDSGRRRPVAARAALFVLVTVALATLMVAFGKGRPPEADRTYRTSILPPSGVSFAPHHFAISPDGAKLAFVGIGPDGQSSLWLHSFDARGAQAMEETRNAESPFWAPDSRRLAFFADGRLKVVDTTKGAVQVLADAPQGGGGAWNRTGTIVFAPNVRGPLVQIPESGGAPRPATSIGPETGKTHRWPVFLPDGRHFLYFQEWGVPGGALPNGFYAGSLQGGEAKLVSAELSGSLFYASGHLLYVKDGSLMAQPFDTSRLELTGPAVTVLDRELEKDDAFSRAAVSVSENGVMVFESLASVPSELVWYDRGGREIGRIAQTGLRDPDISPDGRFLAVTSADGRNGRTFVRVLDLERGVSSVLTDGGQEGMPLWSPDGARIAYRSGNGPRYALAQVPADASGESEILFEGPRMLPNDFTPDGRGLLFMRLDAPVTQVALLDVGERQARDLFPGSEAQLSPSGEWLACLVPPREDVGREVFVRPFPGPGPRVQVSRAGGAQPRWSRDGRRLFFIAPDRKLMEVELEVAGGRLSAGVPRALFQTRIVAQRYVLFQFDVTGDGSRFLVNSLRPGVPLTLVTNWPRALGR